MNGSTKTFVTLDIDTELALKDHHINSKTKYLAANIIKTDFIKSTLNFSDFKTVKFIKEKTPNNNIIFTEADEGNTVTAIKNNENIDKMLAYLKSENYQIWNRD